MKISIFGLGYVGSVSLACMVRDGHEVIGVDIDETKLGLIRGGQSPIVEEGILQLMSEAAVSDRLQVSSDAEQAILATDLSFVCIGTPSLPNGSQNLDALKRFAEKAGKALRQKSETHTIVIRSTVQPGAVNQVIIPILEQYSGKAVDRDFSVCFQPEFLREGSSIKDYDNPPMTVVGVRDQRAADQLRSLFGHLPNDFIETDVATAEMLKYTCNAFHATKVSFANEIGRICQSLGTDSHQVMELLCEDKRLNISSAYLRPGFAFGGSCLPKDLKALLYLAKSNDIEVPLLSGLLPSNQIHIDHAIDTILQSGARSVGVIGLSFKSGTDDLRESPLVELVERLLGKGLSLKIYDPEVKVSRLIGANQRYIEETVPHIQSLLCDSLERVLEHARVIVIGLRTAEIVEALKIHGTGEHYFLDLVNIREEIALPGEYRGICW
jgi:GDP-mannose 6-dehydrogenase